MLIFDFDGVLINSLDEVVLTTYNAATDSLVTSLAQLPADLVQMFKNNRFHVQPIGDAIVLMNWCLANGPKDSQKILNRQEYETLTSKADVDLVDRTNRIYAIRRRFIDTDIERWLALHQTYQPLWNELTRRQNCLFMILTNKNHDATYRLCRHFGLNIEAENIYSGDSGTTKIENMLQILKRFGRQPFFFIDDSFKNLKELDFHFNRNHNVLSLALAAWGYTGADDARRAPDHGYQAFQQTDVIKLIDASV
jgi:phosphoglycolate phosphatase-like HAD superfamily hydrolase